MSDTSPEILSTLTEVFIALIGFSGVVVALGRSRIPEGVRSFRIRALLFSSSVGLAASIVPSITMEFTENVWAVATAGLAMCMAGNLVWAMRNLIPIYVRGQTPPVTFWLTTAGTTLLIVVLLLTAIEPAVVKPVGVYVAAVAWHVYLALLHFSRLILSVEWAADRP